MTAFTVYSKRLATDEIYDNVKDLAVGLALILEELDAKGGDFVLAIDKDEEAQLDPGLKERVNRLGKEWSP